MAVLPQLAEPSMPIRGHGHVELVEPAQQLDHAGRVDAERGDVHLAAGRVKHREGDRVLVGVATRHCPTLIHLSS